MIIIDQPSISFLPMSACSCELQYVSVCMLQPLHINFCENTLYNSALVAEFSNILNKIMHSDLINSNKNMSFNRLTDGK